MRIMAAVFVIAMLASCSASHECDRPFSVGDIVTVKVDGRRAQVLGYRDCWIVLRVGARKESVNTGFLGFGNGDVHVQPYARVYMRSFEVEALNDG